MPGSNNPTEYYDGVSITMEFTGGCKSQSRSNIEELANLRRANEASILLSAVQLIRKAYLAVLEHVMMKNFRELAL